MNFVDAAPVDSGAPKVEHDAVWIRLRLTPVRELKLLVASMGVEGATAAKVAIEASQRDAFVILVDDELLRASAGSDGRFTS